MSKVFSYISPKPTRYNILVALSQASIVVRIE